MQFIDAEQVHASLDWPSLIEAMRAAHANAEIPQLDDMLLGTAEASMLVRGVAFPGAGLGVKAVSVFPGNRGREPALPAVQGMFLLFDKDDGRLLAAIDGAAITPWKTAADSALGSQLLSRPDIEVMAMIGAGNMARPLIEAHLSARPSISRVIIWNRTKPNAEALAASLGDLGCDVQIADDLADAVHAADLVCSATFATEPLIKGEWLKPGAHVDLVGAFRPDMREADDETLRRGRLFVDARATTIHHIGELMIPLKTGVITEADVDGDFFDLCGNAPNRQWTDITIFKNGGGAHLDLITARLIHERVTASAA
jgi:ornithine cyclodeaminase